MNNLFFDLVWRVCEENGGVLCRGAHLRGGPLQGREEHRVDEGGLEVPDAGGHVPSHSEIRVLRPSK